MIQNLWAHYQNLKKQRVGLIRQTQENLKQSERLSQKRIAQLTEIMQYEATDVIQTLQNILMREIKNPHRKPSTEHKIQVGDRSRDGNHRTPNKIAQRSLREIESQKSIQFQGPQNRHVADRDKQQLVIKSNSSIKLKNEPNERGRDRFPERAHGSSRNRVGSSNKIQDNYQLQQYLG